ncbi:MAG: hypothetical protein ABIQ35_06100 [Verrucomicrobiota bacterium]
METKPIRYTDGNVAQVGDLIRIDNGEREGRVEDIVDSREEVEAWGLDHPGILVKNDYYGRVFLAEMDFKEDEIVLVSRNNS